MINEWEDPTVKYYEELIHKINVEHKITSLKVLVAVVLFSHFFWGLFLWTVGLLFGLFVALVVVGWIIGKVQR